MKIIKITANAIMCFLYKYKAILGTDISNIGIALTIGGLFSMNDKLFYATFGVIFYIVGFFARRK